MATAGRKPKPQLQVVKEGNPGKRPLKDSAVLPPSALCEPEWLDLLPGDEDVAATAGRLWKRNAPTLARSVGLVGEQQEVLVDYCITWARIEQGERALSRDGMVIRGAMGGVVKNPWTTVLNQYRSHLRSLIGELGLSPASATRITRPESSSEDDPFD
ncbi:MAG: phage terminase small subunit P27 family [Nocardioides sp.]|nr:phage terminase small subunit P27 family [Nocardioides sp.]